MDTEPNGQCHTHLARLKKKKKANFYHLLNFFSLFRLKLVSKDSKNGMSCRTALFCFVLIQSKQSQIGRCSTDKLDTELGPEEQD